MKNLQTIILGITIVSIISCKKKADDASPAPAAPVFTSQLYYTDTIGIKVQAEIANNFASSNHLKNGMKTLISTKGDTTLIGISWDVNDNGGANWFFDTVLVAGKKDTLNWGGDPSINAYYQYGPSYINSVKVINNFSQDSLDYLKLVVARYYGGGYNDLRYQSFPVKKQPKAYKADTIMLGGLHADPSSFIYKNAIQWSKLFDDK